VCVCVCVHAHPTHTPPLIIRNVINNLDLRAAPHRHLSSAAFAAPPSPKQHNEHQKAQGSHARGGARRGGRRCCGGGCCWRGPPEACVCAAGVPVSWQRMPACWPHHQPSLTAVRLPLRRQPSFRTRADVSVLCCAVRPRSLTQAGAAATAGTASRPQMTRTGRLQQQRQRRQQQQQQQQLEAAAATGAAAPAKADGAAGAAAQQRRLGMSAAMVVPRRLTRWPTCAAPGGPSGRA
jgi:hypothetical protein